MFTLARYKPLGPSQQIASLVTVQTLTVPTGANVAIIRVGVSATAVSWRDDGVAPTATIGQLMLASDPPFEYSGFLSALQFILATGAPTLFISYYSANG